MQLNDSHRLSLPLPAEPSTRLNRPQGNLLALNQQHRSGANFGNALAMGGFLGGSSLGQIWANILSNPNSRLIFEDVIGFGGLRTTFDLSRNALYKDSTVKGANTSLARERIFREIGNLFATNFLGGLIIYQLAKLGGKAFDKAHLGKQFASIETIDWFNNTLNHQKFKANPTRQGFIDAMSEQLAHTYQSAQSKTIQSYLEQVFDRLSHAEQSKSAQVLRQKIETELGSGHKWLEKFDQQATKHPEKAINQVAKDIAYQIKRHTPREKQVWYKRLLGIKLKPASPESAKLVEQLSRIQQSFKTSGAVIEDAAVNLAKAINPNATSFDIKLNALEADTKAAKQYAHYFKLDELLTDTKHYLGRIEEGVSQSSARSWKHTAEGLAKRTHQFTKWALPVAFGASLVLTVVVPLFNKMLTRKVDKIKTYPGEIGLREMESVNTGEKGWFETYMPYIAKATKKGNYIPFLVSLLPLPFALGMVDNLKLMDGKLAMNNPFKRGFLRKAARMFQFRKGFPYVPAQQLTALCALVSSARIWTARDKIEARERYVDSYGGWAAWIWALPNIKNAIKKGYDKLAPAKKTVLMKKVGDLTTARTGTEISRFFADKPELIKRTLRKNKVIGEYIFLPLMLLTMGVAEPLIALKWTEAQVKKIFGSMRDKKWLAVGKRLTRRSSDVYAQKLATSSVQQASRISMTPTNKTTQNTYRHQQQHRA